MDIWVRLGRFSMVESERCFLRPFFYSDLPDFKKIVSNKDNLSFIFPPQSSVKSEVLAVHAFMKNPLGIWVIEDKISRRMIGIIRFEKIDESKKTAEIGYFLNIDYWNKGYMTEVVRKISNLSFEQFGFKELLIITHKENIASQRVALKSGFKYIRTFRGSDRYTHKMKNYFIFKQTEGYRDE